MQHEHILLLENVSFRFAGQECNFFEGLSVAFPGRAIHFIQGQNGAGKSTFFSILQGGVQPRESLLGRVVIDGKKLEFTDQQRSGLSELKDNVKMVQQAFDGMIADQLSFESNLRAAGMGRYPTLAGLPLAKPIPDLINRFQIDMQKPAHLLSGGQRQILAILMALQKPAKILLLDEPTAALDQKNSEMVMDFLHELKEKTGLTILIITHDREIMARYAQHGHYRISVSPDGKRSVGFQS